jgi:hypothetical protein
MDGKSYFVIIHQTALPQDSNLYYISRKNP